MLKKVIPIVLSLCLIFSISVMAENENPASERNMPQVSEQTPQGIEENPQPGNGNMRTPPNMSNGEIPPEGMGRFPGDMQNNNQQNQQETPMTFLGFVKTYSTPITSVVLLISAFFFVIFYRRKNY